MSAYTRQPARTVAHCPYCKWIRIYFEDPAKRMRHQARASQAVDTHIRRAHHKRAIVR